MKTADNGKGDRPRKVDKTTYDENYERIFKRCDACKGRCEVGDIKGGPCQ